MELELIKKAAVRNSLRKKKIDFLATGVGITATAYRLTKELYKNRYDLAINAGLAGTFKNVIKLGEVVNVVSDCFADLGAKKGTDFLTLAEMGLQEKNKFPFRNGWLHNSGAQRNGVLKELKKANAITVNTVHDGSKNIKKVLEKFNPDIETMEGAAFFYVCILEKIPCVQLRAVSNIVGVRDKRKWNIPLALKNLVDETVNFIETEH